MMLPACQQCGAPYPPEGAPFRCPHCGGLFDFPPFPAFDLASLDRSKPGIWRYWSLLPGESGQPNIYLGEGDTPLVPGQSAGRQVYFKLEAANPSGSYKDRGSAVLVSHLVSRGVREAVEDSSGNAGASFAAYAARAGIHARVFVPESASGPKLTQIRNFGAELVAVPGPRSQAAQAVLREAESGAAYASHAFLPFGLPGIATIAYEVWEALGGAPGTVIAPAGHGSLLLGIMRGFDSLRRSGLIAAVPHAVGVQAAACAPLAAAQESGLAAIGRVQEGQTIAEGVRVRRPVWAEALLDRFAVEGAGRFIAFGEEQILAAYRDLAAQGIYAEPTSALAWAALSHPSAREWPEPIVLIISGSGLKSNHPIE